jgi:tetratricopeptide (TPR) repeat protein
VVTITPAAAGPWPVFCGVPQPPAHGLFGREALLAELSARLRGGAAAALATDGQGGVGKTAVAVALARDPALRGHFRDGVLWASLGPGGDPAGALRSWAEALGLAVDGLIDPWDLHHAVNRAIGARRLLLVLDDIWPQTPAERERKEPESWALLRCGGPECVHLLTTRDNGLAVAFAGAAGAQEVPVLDEAAAFALLQELAPEACAVDEAAARALPAAVGGLALAVELLGGFLGQYHPDPELFPEASRARLEELGSAARRLDLAGRRLGDERGGEQALRAVMALSLEALGDDERAAFLALGAFAPRPALFSKEAAAAVSEDAALLPLFVSRHLLGVSDGALALHQVIAAVARERLPEGAQARHAAYYLALVNEGRKDWRRIEAAYAQIEWAFARVADEECLPWVWALREHQSTRGLIPDHMAWHARGLRAAEAAGDRASQAALLSNLGWANGAIGRPSEALALYEQALPIRREAGDRAGEATTLNNMGMVYQATGRPSEALALYEQALPIRREVGDRAGEATTLNNMATVYQATGRPSEALVLFEQALPIRREVGDRAGEAATLNNMGMVYQATGRPSEALALYEQALPLMREVGDRAGEAGTLHNMAGVYYAIGRGPEALALYEQALPLSREAGDRAGEATTLNNMAAVYDATGRPSEALARFEQALPILREVGHRAGEAATLWNMAVLLEGMGHTQQALARLEEALALFRGGLTHDGAGNTVEEYEAYGQALRGRGGG